MVTKPTYQYLFLDLDGFLADTWDHTVEVFNIFARSFCLTLDMQKLQNLLSSGKTFIQCCQDLFPDYDEDVFHDLVKDQSEAIQNSYELTKPVLGMPDILRCFRADCEIKIAVVTNRQENHGLSIVLSRAGLETGNNIDIVVCLREGFEPKPSPQLFYKAMCLLGLLPRSSKQIKRCLIAGDSLADLNPLRGVIPTCAGLWGYGDKTELQKASPTYFAENPSQFQSIVIHGEV